MRLFISGSAPLLAETFDAFRARTGQRHPRTLRHDRNRNVDVESSRRRAARRHAWATVARRSIRIVDDAAHLRARRVGGIEVKGPNVSRATGACRKRPARNSRADGYFKTGDMASWTPKATFASSGRAKDLIISGGLNVYPKEIEERIDAIDGRGGKRRDRRVLIADLGEAVVAIVVARPDDALTETSIIARLKNDIANFKVPKRVVFVDELPRNAMGKVQKNVLRAQYRDLMSPATRGSASPPGA